ncbi:MAG: hypothetical protein H6618_10130 [Deltaproteobacteria bacterium]|nr:hypothetical protein [Deltaproteobacteria bacterium]
MEAVLFLLIAAISLTYIPWAIDLAHHSKPVQEDLRQCPRQLHAFLDLPQDSPCEVPPLHAHPRHRPKDQAPEAICAIARQAGDATDQIYAVRKGRNTARELRCE